MTRASIIRATLELIRTGGLGATTVPAIAKAADVAPTTVRRTISPSSRTCSPKSATPTLVDLAVPDVDIFDGLASTTDQVSRLARELVAFYAPGQEWWFIFTNDAAMSPAFEPLGGQVRGALRAGSEEALGPMVDDPLIVAMVASVIGPPLHYALVSRGCHPTRWSSQVWRCSCRG